jgi:methyltransferase (TIGR00027 family)
MKVLGFAIYIIVQILFIPLAIVGVLLIFYRQMFVSRRLGVSSTGVDVINGRWVMDVFGIRKDTASVKLSGALPNNSIFGNWLSLFPLYLLYRITGETKIYPTVPAKGEERMAHLVLSRTIYFDNIIGQSKDNVEQFVVMGAGYDTRSYGDLKSSDLKFFELDQKKTQKLKIESLEKAGVHAGHVAFVEVDFSKEHWYERLEESGYDRDRRTIFLWEGVTLYLSRSDVCKTLRDIKEHSAEGSVVVADIYSESFVSGDYAPGMKKGMKPLKLTNEEFGFGLDFSSAHERVLKEFLESQHMKVGESYFLGAKSKKGPYMAVVEILS